MDIHLEPQEMCNQTLEREVHNQLHMARLILRMQCMQARG
jgi:hypothetical protein